MAERRGPPMPRPSQRRLAFNSALNSECLAKREDLQTKGEDS